MDGKLIHWEGHISGISGSLWIYHSTEELQIPMLRVIGMCQLFLCLNMLNVSWWFLCSDAVEPGNKCTLSVLCYFKDNGNAFSDYSTTETSMLQHVRSRAHRATQSMCFCHQADCIPREPVILGVRFYFEQTVFGPQAPRHWSERWNRFQPC